MKQTKFPPGWDEKRVRRLLAYYEAQTENEAVAEDEAAIEEPDATVMKVPRALVPAVRELIAKRHAHIGPRRRTKRRTGSARRP